MNEEYTFKFLWRMIFLAVGLLCILIGFATDGIKLLGTTTKKGVFAPLVVGCYESCSERDVKYRWKIKYEFWVDGEKYVGSKFLRGGEKTISYKKEIGYLKVYPKINWLITDDFKGIHCIIGFLLGHSIIWIGFKKRRVASHDLSRSYNGIYFSNTGILPVKGLNFKECMKFLVNMFKVGFTRMLIIRVFFYIAYICAMWLLIIWARDSYPHNAIVTVISWLTYAQGGVHGSILNVAGGIIGKIVFVSFFLQIVLNGKYETNYFQAYPVRNPTIYGHITNLGSFLLGIGLAMILFAFMTAGLSYEDSIIGFILFLGCWKAQKNINNPILILINSNVAGKPRNGNAARIGMLGASLGFLISFVLIWTEYIEYIGYYSGTMLSVSGALIIYLGSLIKRSDSEIEVEL